MMTGSGGGGEGCGLAGEKLVPGIFRGIVRGGGSTTLAVRGATLVFSASGMIFVYVCGSMPMFR